MCAKESTFTDYLEESLGTSGSTRPTGWEQFVWPAVFCAVTCVDCYEILLRVGEGSRFLQNFGKPTQQSARVGATSKF
jgi:hypothetical protein